MLNPLKVFVAASSTLHVEGQCKSTKGALTSVRKISLLNNQGRRSVTFWHSFSILDVEVLTLDSPSTLQVNTMLVWHWNATSYQRVKIFAVKFRTRMTSESQSNVYVNNWKSWQVLMNKSLKSVFICLIFVSAKAHPKSMTQSSVIMSVIYNKHYMNIYAEQKNKLNEKSEADKCCMSESDRQKHNFAKCPSAECLQRWHQSQSKQTLAAFPCSQARDSAAICVYFCGSLNVGAVVP